MICHNLFKHIFCYDCIRSNIRIYSIHIPYCCNQVECRHFSNSGAGGPYPFRTIFQPQIGIRNFSVIRILCIKHNPCTVKSVFYIAGIDLYRNLAFSINRIGNGGDFSIHYIIWRFPDFFWGCTVRNFSLSHSHPYIVHFAPPCQNFSYQRFTRQAVINAVFKFSHQIPPIQSLLV